MAATRRARTMGLFVAALAAGAAIGGVAEATIPDSVGVIHGCYAKGGETRGLLRVIDPGGGRACASGETPLTWSQRGTRGPAGQQGRPGPTGPAGLQGDPGPIGPAGAPGTSVAARVRSLGPVTIPPDSVGTSVPVPLDGSTFTQQADQLLTDMPFQVRLTAPPSCLGLGQVSLSVDVLLDGTRIATVGGVVGVSETRTFTAWLRLDAFEPGAATPHSIAVTSSGGLQCTGPDESATIDSVAADVLAVG